jgi:hypothetical protein
LVFQQPASGRSGVKVRVNRQFYIDYFNRFSTKYQAICRLLILVSMIPADGYFEPDLSLRIDSAVNDLEEMHRGSPVHVSVVVKKVMEDLARGQIARIKGGVG